MAKKEIVKGKARPPKKALEPIEVTAKKPVARVALIDEALEEFIHPDKKKQRHVPTAEPTPTHSVSNPRSYGRPAPIEVE